MTQELQECEHLRSADHHARVFKKIYGDVWKRGKKVCPRGQLVVEIEDYSYVLPPYVRFQSFASRKLNLSYTKREIMWYLRGDKYDTSICDYAKMWRDLVNNDGSLNSNYGQYIFDMANQFDNVVNTLAGDKDSRRASMVILNKDHLFSDTKDVPCTYSINFRIRENALNMSVTMRSQDLVFGMGNDAPAFSVIHEMMLHALRRTYPHLQYGTYHHYANSFHCYERHFATLKTIATGDDKFELVMCPKISSPDEVDFLRKLDYTNIPEGYRFTQWLVNV